MPGNRSKRRLRIRLLCLLFLIALALSASAEFQTVSFSQSLGNVNLSFITSPQSFLVTNVNDNGPGSFREAITNANLTPGTDTIVFNIPGTGAHVINLLTPLPEITDPVVVGADAQPGYGGTPLIQLDGTNAGAGANGLVITGGNTIVRGLAIGGFQGAGIVLRSCDANGIQANYIGLDANGALARPNNIGIQLFASSNNLIGGTVVAMRNVVSGNLSHGVEVNGTGNTIQGNLIGTDASGTRKVPNLIGIQAPRVRNTLIGGLTAGARNVVSGNKSTGVFLSGEGSKLQGNFVGTDITGTLALGNDGGGVLSGDKTLIGGTVPEARNVIAANGAFGNVVLDLSPSPGATVQGNYIGTDVTGTRPLGHSSIGITIVSDNNLIGGSVPGAQNVISGHLVGIKVGDHFGGGPGHGNIIQGNLIGLNALGSGPLPNVHGISFQEGSSNNTVGGTQSAAANRIAFNSGTGVLLATGSGNSVRGNSIFSNGELGIDVDAHGVTPNDVADSDVGANNVQNFPVITSVLAVGNSTTIQGSLNSTPNTTFQLDFYSSAAVDPSGNGEGALFIGTTPVTTDGNGNATINVTLPVVLGSGRALTATATDPNGNTSEFSSSQSIGASGNLQFSVSAIQVIEDVGLVNVTVLRKGGSAGTLTVDYETIEGTATPGQDYTATSGTLTFNGGETSRSFQIAVTDDTVVEPEETLTVVLRNTTNPEALGTPNTLVVTIEDEDPLELLLEQFGPTVKQAAAVDALLFLRDTFPVAGIPDWFSTSSDRNTRVMFFVRRLQWNPGESPAGVTVRLLASNSQLFEVPAEDVRAVPNVDLTQIVIRLPDGLSADVYTVTVSAHLRTSNSGTIRIAP